MEMDAFEVAGRQADWTAAWHVRNEDPVGLEGLMVYVLGNHRCNFDLWHEEDRARREDMGFEYVYRAKRAIDALNQKRNDFIERMDQLLFERLRPDVATAPLNSETPGMIMDRLSILALKVFHMEEQTRRMDASESHLANCMRKVGVLVQQRKDLTAVLQALLDEIRNGKRAYKVYFQFKMYNDPATNPQLYGNKGERGRPS
jgi:hypothetical protein